ncbi:MAG: ATP-dependent RecD-like DNA helicase [Acidibacillus sp.]|nr:ATP-dependent RecD-like DNA helicase [Acidibacillus sp.]
MIPCGNMAFILQNRKTGNIEAIRYSCGSWSCEHCSPYLAATTRDLLIPQLIQYDTHFFSTLTLPLQDRILPLPAQAKRLHQLLDAIIDKSKYLFAPNYEIYKKFSSRSKTSKSKDTSAAYWQKRYTTYCLKERADAIEYDTYMSLYIKAHGSYDHTIALSNYKHARILRIWGGMIHDPIRYSSERDLLATQYDHATSHMLVTQGTPTYYATYELHADQNTAHLHVLTDVPFSHYGLHSVMYGKSVAKKRLQRFREGLYTPLPYDWVYQCIDISNEANRRTYDTHEDADFAHEETLETTSLSINRVYDYIGKTLQYMTKELGETMEALHIKSPDLHARHLVAREKTKNEDYTLVAKVGTHDNMPLTRIDLSPYLDADQLLSISDDTERKRLADHALQQSIGNHSANYDTVHIMEKAYASIPFTIHYFPLMGRHRYLALIDRKERGEILSKKEAKQLRTLYKRQQHEWTNLRISTSTPILLASFSAKPLAVPPVNPQLDDQQRQAILYFCRFPVSIMTGDAGSGKTYVIKELVTSLQLPPHQTLLLSKNGKAAALINERLRDTPYEAKTIHRALQSSLAGTFGLSAIRTLSQIRYVIIDEVGTVDKLLLDSLLQALPQQTKLLLTGDSKQLPPIHSGSPLAELLTMNKIPTTILGTSHRNEDHVLRIAQSVINKEISPLLDSIRPYSEDTIIALHQQDYQIIVNSLDQMERINRLLQNKDGIKFGAYQYSVGDPVIHLKNDYTQDVYNGDMGVVVYATHTKLSVQYGHKTVTYTSRESINIALAYCLTVHKAQGSEYPKAAIVMDIRSKVNRLLTNQWLYTAITRAKTDVCLLITPTPVDPQTVLRTIVHRQTILSDSHNYSNAKRVADYLFQVEVAMNSSE